MAGIKCEYCGGNNSFDPTTGGLKCEHCGKKLGIKQNFEQKSLTRKYSLSYIPEPKITGNSQYICSSCGATVSFEDSEEKRRCPSCGDESLNKQHKNMFVPDAVIPFAISRNRAIEIFQKWISERKFAPKDLKQMARLGKISGLYIPAWNFNYRIKGSYYGECTYLEKVSSDYVTTRHQYVTDSIDKTYTNVLISANKRISDSTIQNIGPYDMIYGRPYASEYLFGFSGLDSDANIHDVYENMVENKKDAIESSVRAHLKNKYDTIEYLNMSLSARDSSFNYVYLPVWANHYTYKGKKYHCYINGQNGKPTGRAPRSFWKIMGLVLGIIAIIAIPTIILISKFG